VAGDNAEEQLAQAIERKELCNSQSPFLID